MATRGETELLGLMQLYPKAGLTLADAGDLITAKINQAYGTNYGTSGLSAPIPGYGTGGVAPGMQAPGSTTSYGFTAGNEPSYTFNPTTGVQASNDPNSPTYKPPAPNYSGIYNTLSGISSTLGQITPQAIQQGIKSNVVGYGPSSYTGSSVVDYLNSLGKASDFNSRATLAAQFGISGYTGTAAQNTQLLNTLRTMGPTSPNTTPTGPTGSGLSGTGSNPINLGTNSPSNLTSANSMVAGVDATLKSIQDFLAPPNDALHQKYNDLSAQIEGMLSNQAGRGATQLAAEQVGGIPELKKSLADVNAQILSKLASYKATQSQYDLLSADLQGKPITMNSIVGSQSQIDRVAMAKQKADAADIGLLQATAQGLQGQLAAAQDTANRAVDLKYQDTKDAIDLRLQQLQLLEGQLTKADKIRADAITLYLQNQKEKLSVQVANEKDINSTILNLMQKYADAGWTGIPKTVAEATALVTKNSKIYQQETRLAGSSGTADKPLSILDIQRYNDLYPDANIQAGDTEAIANNKVQISNSPEAKTRALIQGFKDGGETYNKVVGDIDSAPTITDKSLAKKIAGEVYGVTDTQPSITTKSVPISNFGAIGDTINNTINSIYNSLFNR